MQTVKRAIAILCVLSAVVLGACSSDSTRKRASERSLGGEAGESPVPSDFWEYRLTYPTGRLDPAWIKAARDADRSISRALPAGVRSQNSASGVSFRSVLDTHAATALGPAPLDWSDTYGMVGGRANVIVTHPTNTSVAWFGSDGGGVWKTSNCCGPATTWSTTTDQPDIANIAISTMALDPNNPDIVYAGTGDYRRNRPFGFGASGLLRSIDGGNHWSVLGEDVFTPVYSQPNGVFPQYRSISTIAVDPNDGSRLVVGTSQGLYFSHDTGVNWSGPCLTNTFTDQRQDITGLLAINQGGTTELMVAVGTIARPSTVRPDLRLNGANGIYRATMPASGCASGWSLISRSDNGWPAGSGSGIPVASPGGNPLRRIDIAMAPGDNNILYAQVMFLGVFRSLDGGTTWSQRAIDPDNFSGGCVTDPLSGLVFEDYSAGLSISPTDANTLFLTSTDLWRSTDGGLNFTNVTCGYDEISPGVAGTVHVDHHARAYVGGSPQNLLIGTDGGVSFTSNAQASQPDFTAINNGTNTIEFYSGDITARFNDPASPLRGIAAGAQDNGSSTQTWASGVTPALANWKVRFAGDGVSSRIEPILGQRWYHSSQFGYIAASIAGPNAPVDNDVTPSDDWAGDRRGFLMPYTLYTNGDATTCPPATGCQRMLAGTFRVWESITGGLPNTSWVANSPDLTKTLATNNDLSIINKVVHIEGNPSAAIVGTNDGNVQVGFGLGQGSANSATWVNVTDANAQLPNRPIMDVASDPRFSIVAYATLSGFNENTPGSLGHIYRLACNANCSVHSWINRSGNLPDIPVNAIALNPNVPGQAFVGTDWGLYFTDDIDASTPVWQRLDIGVPSSMVWDLVIDRGATTLAIFTRSRGAWVWPLPGGDRIFANGFDG
ncbi:MAG: hypothetical protein ABIW82_07600 [Dokdonella sp.]